MSLNWTCPYCNRAQSVTHDKISTDRFPFKVKETADGVIGLEARVICCANSECLKYQLDITVITAHYSEMNYDFHLHKPTAIKSFRILPESMAKPQPDCIPAPLKQDYFEACKIRDLSPKASATLARRCLQGMIRDFAKVKEASLYKEIEKLNELAKTGNAPKGVSEDSIDSLHHVRSLGNIGAHMEKDINVIIPVDPHEAQILIDLIEILFEEWYVAREKRWSKFAALKATAEEKQALKELPKPAPKKSHTEH